MNDEDLRADNAALRRDLDRLQNFIRAQLTPAVPYWYMNGGVMKQSGDRLQQPLTQDARGRAFDARQR